MKTKTFLLLPPLMILTAMQLSAQVNPDAFTYQMIYVPVEGQTGNILKADAGDGIQVHGVNPGHGAFPQKPETFYSRTCRLLLPDTISIAAIHLVVGTSKDSADVFSHSFVYDQATGLPEGMSWSREGNEVHIGLFRTTDTDMHHYKVWLEDVNGNLSEPRYFY
ncbi:MAG: hypothetical protein KJ607_11215 [Bacteroidetes bacterium]|nr:hypothetical protein [Bacteroidota bacterium]